MKLAILSDSHGNWPGLTTVVEHIERWQPDQVAVLGDVVNRGPNSARCWDFVQRMRRERGWLATLGNHEEYVINQSLPQAARAGIPFDVYRPSFWTYEQLGRDVSALQALPFSLDEWFDGTIVRLTHASMLGTREGIFPFTRDDELPAMIGEPVPALLAVGHTHQPLVRSLGDTLVVNAGASGMPFDGDWRVSYAQLELRRGKWQGRIIRLEYDRAQAERDFDEAGFIAGGGPLARVMLRELQVASGLLYTFLQRYEPPVLAGEITLEDAVDEFLEGTGK